MDGHVEVVCFKGVCHLPKALQGVLPRGLLKAKGFRRPLTLLRRPQRDASQAVVRWSPVRSTGSYTLTKILSDCGPYLSHTLGTAPVAFRGVGEGRQQAEGVVVVITTVTQQKLLILVTTATHSTHKRVHLGQDRGGIV